MAREPEAEVLAIDGREVPITHPDKPYFSREVRLSKLDLVRYFLSVAPGALAGIRDRPLVLKRFVDGAEGQPFYQKRAPASRPAWLRTVSLSFPSGRTAEEVVVDDAAGLAWVVNLGCIELHPHPVRAGDLDHPDELRIDLDPTPGVAWDDVRRVAMEVKAFLEEVGLRGWPKTSGSRGMHVNVRIRQRWTFTEVRRAALALSREIERRMPALATSRWWKEERRGVFLDYNQNAKDRTTCSAYSVRPLPDARVSAPLAWDEVPACEPADFTVLTMPKRFAEIGDLHAGMDDAAGTLEGLLERAARDEAAGLADAPWPPHFRKVEGEGCAGGAVTGEGSGQAAPGPDAAHRRRQLAGPGSGACRPRAMEGTASRGGAAPRGRRRAGRFHARTIVDLDADSREPSPCSRGDPAGPRAGPTRTTIQPAPGERACARQRRAAEIHSLHQKEKCHAIPNYTALACCPRQCWSVGPRTMGGVCGPRRKTASSQAVSGGPTGSAARLFLRTQTSSCNSEEKGNLPGTAAATDFSARSGRRAEQSRSARSGRHAWPARLKS